MAHEVLCLAFRRNNPLSQKKNATYGEVILTNYDPRPYMQPQTSLFPLDLESGDLVLVHEPQGGELRSRNLEIQKEQ